MQITKRHLITLAALLAMDGIWILNIAKPFYKKQLGSMMGPTQWWAVVAFYLVYTQAIVKLTDDKTPLAAAKRGALLGAASYGAYNFTNMAILKNWTKQMTALDLTWGTGMTAAAAAIAEHFSP